MRVTIDTNIIFSALFFNSSICTKILDSISEQHDLIINNFLLSETEWTTERKFYNYRWPMREFLRTIQYKYFAVRKQQIRDLKLKIRDNRDQKILGGAIVSRCDILITGDKDFFEHRYKGIEIMTPADFIKKYCSINQL